MYVLVQYSNQTELNKSYGITPFYKDPDGLLYGSAEILRVTSLYMYVDIFKIKAFTSYQKSRNEV